MTEMLNQGIIKYSSSPYNSPIWIVPKEEDKVGNKEWRIVIDYRKLNIITKDDIYSIPIIDDFLDKLDLTKSIYQIEVHPQDREKSAFSTANGHFWVCEKAIWLKKNAPATFQSIMYNVLREHINKNCLVYMDDILIFSTSLQEHMENLGNILRTLEEANFAINYEKNDRDNM